MPKYCVETWAELYIGSFNVEATNEDTAQDRAIELAFKSLKNSKLVIEMTNNLTGSSIITEINDNPTKKH